MNASNRLDGWKAIGNHFGRDRTTVMRWARERGLPVRRLPGGKTGTVYALKEDLDQWASNQDDLGQDDSAVPVSGPVPASFLQRGRRFWLAGAALAAILAMVVAVVMLWPRPVQQRLALPSNPEVATLYLEGRDLWASRKPETLRQAMAAFTTVTQRAPDFAPAWAALADVHLLSREFDSVNDKAAFEAARTAATTALKLDPDLAEAHRAIGFIAYWWDNDPRSAGTAFRRALELAPRNAQTHFWYGNVLSDNGQHVAALRELNAARLIEPGSVAIRTDLAWAQWAAGDEARARQALTDLLRDHPDFVVAQDCLSIVQLSDGDYVSFVQTYSVYARLRGSAEEQAYAQRLRAALSQGVDSVQSVLMQNAMSDLSAEKRKTHAWPVLLASVAQDRGQVLDLLARAESRKERWGEAAVVGRILRLWSGDEEIARRVGALRAPAVA
ncbi:tetratricopeptide repeat family protein [Asticcacaulis biprosthecium C19]|uniref:Tetratricopeptide repeat family protein n=1 Tax=Asticcacaulis biprosthecium C19 TaxID=715226 RepID=F4QH84_9CAUL|nr:tetratricopeptide repeat protein [Asticcacaulis biprosthecium]EGF92621.1 tetratricopeptide repeat family protein [Asticcacaulis biprosthecium C19]